jgi:hypothetical protein
MARWEVVYHVSSSVHVIVEAPNEEQALLQAEGIALDLSESVTINYSRAGVPDGAAVSAWWGSVDDIAYVDQLEG